MVHLLYSSFRGKYLVILNNPLNGCTLRHTPAPGRTLGLVLFFSSTSVSRDLMETEFPYKHTLNRHYSGTSLRPLAFLSFFKGNLRLLISSFQKGPLSVNKCRVRREETLQFRIGLGGERKVLPSPPTD